MLDVVLDCVYNQNWFLSFARSFVRSFLFEVSLPRFRIETRLN